MSISYENNFTYAITLEVCDDWQRQTAVIRWKLVVRVISEVKMVTPLGWQDVFISHTEQIDDQSTKNYQSYILYFDAE